MKAAIYLDVPDWQIGQEVTIFFPDTMMKHEKCELLKEQRTANLYKCPNCGTWVSAENVVRCKDCINHNNNGCRFCRYGVRTKDDFFCADGERKEVR